MGASLYGGGIAAEHGKGVGARAVASPNKVFSDTARYSAKEVESDRKRKAKEEVKAKRRRSKYSSVDDKVAARKAYSRHDEGVLPEEANDISPDHLQLKMGFYETKVVVTPETVNCIERHTLDQADNELWVVER